MTAKPLDLAQFEGRPMKLSMRIVRKCPRCMKTEYQRIDTTTKLIRCMPCGYEWIGRLKRSDI